jgi:hypothetical protein
MLESKSIAICKAMTFERIIGFLIGSIGALWRCWDALLIEIHCIEFRVDKVVCVLKKKGDVIGLNEWGG